jgi:hypothetical protein
MLENPVTSLGMRQIRNSKQIQMIEIQNSKQKKNNRWHWLYVGFCRRIVFNIFNGSRSITSRINVKSENSKKRQMTMQHNATNETFCFIFYSPQSSHQSYFPSFQGSNIWHDFCLYIN